MNKPHFMTFGTLGWCVQFPVGNGKWILVPVKAWLKGQRQYGFVNSFGGVSKPEYVCASTIENDVHKAVIDCHMYVRTLERYQGNTQYFLDLMKKYTGIVW